MLLWASVREREKELRSGLDLKIFFDSDKFPYIVWELFGTCLQVPCKFPASSLQVDLHLRCICIADFLDLHMRCRRPLEEFVDFVPGAYALQIFRRCICVVDKSDTRMHRRCRELAGNLQTNGTAYIRNSRLNAWIHTYFLPSLRSKNRILLASPLFHTERAKNNNTPQLHTYKRLLTPHHGQ